ncbi:MAG: hypothetical protein ACJ74Q_09980 [Pyrinomonadaceae bacterium]
MNRKPLALASAVLIFLSANIVAQKRKLREYVIVPAWRIQIVDEAGNPVKGAFVRQVWQDYDVEREGHEQDAGSNNDGYVSFPKRIIRTSPEERAKGRARNIQRLGVHASFGVHAYVLVWGEIVGCQRLEGDADYKEGKPLPSQLKMRKVTLPGFKCTSRG